MDVRHGGVLALVHAVVAGKAGAVALQIFERPFPKKISLRNDSNEDRFSCTHFPFRASFTVSVMGPETEIEDDDDLEEEEKETSADKTGRSKSIIRIAHLDTES